MKKTPDTTPNGPQAEETNLELEDTREFTLEEVQALGLYAEWINHRHRHQNQQYQRELPEPRPGVFPWGV